MKKGILNFLIMSMVVLFASTGMANEAKPSGTVTMQTKAVAIGIGVSWGSGVLTYQGQEYAFKINGLSVIDVGVSTVSAVGDVYSLNKIEDFAGTFTAGDAGIAIGGGVGAVAMKNQNGVVIKLTSTQKGLKLKLAAEGLKIQMK
jgi:hypothetical protein